VNKEIATVQNSLELLHESDSLPVSSGGGEVPWTKPLYSRGRVDSAGEVISGREPETPQMDMDLAMDIAGNWRSSHGYPLHVIWSTLKNRARSIDHDALVPKRIKRLPSVAFKLKRNSTMQLSKMQDLGGCRAVLKSVAKVDKLVRFYQKNPCKTLEFVKPFDYIASPKPDGYRSVHLVYKYQGECESGAYKGLRIEIQIRSLLQHGWATALEVIDTFTGQGLKSSGGE
jgi:putative GTP pyrophosphokinase